MSNTHATGRYLKITILVLLVVGSFLFGKEYTHFEVKKTVANVSGYYIPPFGDGSTYLLVKQKDSRVIVSGYTTSANLTGNLNIGEFTATTTINNEGIAKINLSKDENDFPCEIYLLFFHQPSLTEAPSSKNQQDINSIKVFETNSGTACGLGNNVSFELENKSYEKQDTVPDKLPTSRNDLP